jgi:hypothetical protein
VWRLSEGFLEPADEVRAEEVDRVRERLDVERIRVGAVHGVARAKEAAVLDLAGLGSHAGAM